MKLQEIEINNFRCIENLKVNVDDFIVLIGENSSGKSTVLKGIEFFYSESLRNFSDENFHFKNTNKPIEIILTFDRLTQEEKEQKYIRHWIYNDKVKIKREIAFDPGTQKTKSAFFGWQAKPTLEYFDISKFEDYKGDIAKLVRDNNLPDYFKKEGGNVTQGSYKEGLQKHLEAGLVELGEPGWIPNPGGLSENFASLLPQFYLVPAVKDAQDESKITQTTTLGKLINDLTNRIVTANPKFEEVKIQLDGLKKFLNKSADGTDAERLKEIKDLEQTLSEIISESMPDSKVEIEIITPELIDLFKETRITIDDSIPTSIDNKGHGLQRALIFSYIRAYAKLINEFKVGEQTKRRNFILAVEEPELFLHPNGQRKMMSVLRTIAKDDQVLICSHSSFFVDMFQYPKIAIVRRDNMGPTYAVQYTGDIFENEDQKKSFRYLSFFDTSTSELFFARKVVLVEGNTEKQIIPYWATRLSVNDKRFDFSSNNICVTDCGGKTNFSAFMKVLNNLKIPYIAIHDIDPIDFPEDKPNKSEKEKHSLRMFKENLKIAKLLSSECGKLVRINPELEPIIGVSNSEAEKFGKVRAAYFKYDGVNTVDYPERVLTLMELLVNWTDDQNTLEISATSQSPNAEDDINKADA